MLKALKGLKVLGKLPWKKIGKRVLAAATGYGAGVASSGACEGGGMPVPQTTEEALATLFTTVALMIAMEIRSPQDEPSLIQRDRRDVVEADQDAQYVEQTKRDQASRQRSRRGGKQ